ncbi:MDR family MFS transporter [Bifidobacterium choloepi]|uniref:Multidrug efflux MFS transporter n=1 Tax=Bifidobacterium choloepi TaxID=2614131 RepID=A0A6I5N460_9BIFI|nr:MDR family MFS transporter [Bifidobacterium choloepi]NEG70469.1 multidrug efflux MFS transporter [Bifidobacterium choloepi]
MSTESREEPEENEQHRSSIVAADRPYTRDVHHDEPAPEQPTGPTEPGLRGRIHYLGRSLDREQSYRDGHLTHVAFISLAVMTMITFIGNFTQLQLSAALPTIVSEFGITVTTGQWLTSIFQLTMGVMVPLTAFFTRRFTTRQIVLTSMTVFTIGSLFAWVAPVFPLVLCGRLLEAIGTGVMWPVLQITVFSIFPLDKRGMAMGTVGMAMSVAPAIGPTIGGLQTDMNGWRSIFMSLSVLGVIALVLAFFGLRNFGASDKMARADFFSVALSVIGFGGLMYGFTNIQSYSFVSPIVWAPMVVGVAGIVWFIVRQKKTTRRYESGESSQPALLNVSVMKNKSFTIGTIIAAMSFFSFSSLTVLLPLYIQDCRGYTATISGLVMLPGAIGQAIAQYFGGRALDRFGARPVAMVGTTLLFFATVLMSTMMSTTSSIWWISVCQFIRQGGVGFVLMPVTTWSLNCLEAKQVSAGSAVTNTVRQIAGAIGAPVLILIMSTITVYYQQSMGFDGPGALMANILGIRWALRISAVICFGMVLMVVFGVHGSGAGSARDAARHALSRVRHVHE